MAQKARRPKVVLDGRSLDGLAQRLSASDGLHRHHAKGKQKKSTLDKTLLVHGNVRKSKRSTKRSDSARFDQPEG